MVNFFVAIAFMYLINNDPAVQECDLPAGRQAQRRCHKKPEDDLTKMLEIASTLPRKADMYQKKID